MSIGALCNRNVVAVSREMSVVDAARLMRSEHIGDVLVLEDSAEGRIPAGIVTDRDIVVQVVAAGLDPATLKLRDVLVAPLVTADEHESCADTIRLMTLNGVRRMPVVDQAGCLIGVITLDDLLPHFAGPLAQLSELASRGRQREIELRK
jgi:CBS domain-containing protein